MQGSDNYIRFDPATASGPAQVREQLKPDSMSGADSSYDIGSKFVSYLMQQRRMTEEESRRKAAFAESSLPDFIRRHFDKDYAGLEENTDHNDYLRWRGEVSSHDAASRENEEAGGEYSIVLGLCEGFFDSRMFRGKQEVHLTEREKSAKKRAAKQKEEVTDLLLPPEDKEKELTEGTVRQVNVTRHERNKTLRQLCLEHFGYRCRGAVWISRKDMEQSAGNSSKCIT